MGTRYVKIVRSLTDYEEIICFKFHPQREWSMNSGEYYLFQIDVKKSDESLTALDLAKQTIEYARELEMIV